MTVRYRQAAGPLGQAVGNTHIAAPFTSGQQQAAPAQRVSPTGSALLQAPALHR